MANKVLKVSGLSKQYRLGQLGTGTLAHDINRIWHKVRGKEDPYLQISEVNDRANATENRYVWALQNINFELEQGDVLGIIGKNGAGKSTLLKLLSRITSPTSGSIHLKGRMSSLLEVGTGFHPELTGRENIFLNGAILGMTKKEVASKLDEIVEFSGCAKYLDTPVKRYSTGMVVRVGFAVAAYLESEILVVDEVLAVGDIEFQNKCIGKMKDISSSGRTVLFVSHNLSSVKNLCNKGMVIENGISTFFGSATDAIGKYMESDENLSESVIDFKDYKGRAGNGVMKFNRLEMSVNDQISNKLLIGENLKLKLNINSSSAIRYKMAIHIYRNDQLRLANIENMDSGAVLEPFVGSKEMEIEFQNVNFYPGKYIFSLWIGDVSSHEHIDYLQHCAQFEVVEGASHVKRGLPRATGFVYLSPKWTINNID